jgi:hypothetical protein
VPMREAVPNRTALAQPACDVRRFFQSHLLPIKQTPTVVVEFLIQVPSNELATVMLTPCRQVRLSRLRVSCPQRGLSGELLIRVWSVIQFASQVLPPSSE